MQTFGRAGSVLRSLSQPSISEGIEDDLAFMTTNGRDGPAYDGGPVMAWTWLTLAGLFEIGWAIGLKYTDGFTRPVPSLLTGVSMVISVLLLGLALKTLPVGTGYAVWTGIGTVGTALLGIYLFHEPATVMRLVCIGLIVSGILGLKLASG
jgi:quaternary ammonium compound-resistance protein SugE